MKIVSMSGSLRENVGKKDAKGLRKEGKVPCVVYGGTEQLHVAIDEKQFKPLIFTPDVAFVELDVNGNKMKVILQDIQYHVVTGNIMHVDFLELHDEKPIVMGIPVVTEGVSAGVIKGGVLVIKSRRLKVKALPEEMPEKITVSVDKLEIGDSLKVKDIEAEKFTFLDSPNAVVVAVRVTRAAASAAGEEEEGEGEDATEGAEAEA